MPNSSQQPSATDSVQKSGAQYVSELCILMSRLLALVVLAIYLPGMLAVTLLVLLTSQGPAFIHKLYRRKDGSVVYLYEFRTECWSTYRETPVGSFLKRAERGVSLGLLYLCGVSNGVDQILS